MTMALALALIVGVQTDAMAAGKKCAATTASGAACKNNAVSGSKYCSVHKAKGEAADKAAAAKAKASKSTSKAASKSGQYGQCKATTEKGERCKRNANYSDGLCWQHERMKNNK